MIVDNAKGSGKDFEPDPLLDSEREYEGRLVGVAYLGKHDKDVWVNGAKTGEVKETPTCIMLVEAVEEDTFVERGPEDARYKAPRTFAIFEKYSSHEKSNFFKKCKIINPESVSSKGGSSKVDLSKVVSEPLNFTVTEGEEGKRQNIKEISKVPDKYRKSIPEMQSKPFLYHVDDGAFLGTIEDVPAWFFRSIALDKANDSEEFGQLEAIEEYLESLENNSGSNTSGEELEGDRKPSSEKEEDKEEEPEIEEEVEEKVEEKPKSTRRRRSRSKDDAEEDKFSKMSLDDLEDFLLDNGKTDDDLNEISDENPESDEAYAEGLRKAARAL